LSSCLSKNLKVRICKTVFLLVVFGWSLILEEFRVFANRVLVRIFEPKRKEVAGGWRRLQNEELHNLCTLPYIIGCSNQ
jgi:hypothetical protein